MVKVLTIFFLVLTIASCIEQVEDDEAVLELID